MTTDNTWPFTPGDVVRDTGEDGDDAAWLASAPEETVVVDRHGEHWTHAKTHAWRGDGERQRGPLLLASYGPLTVVDVPFRLAERQEDDHG